MREGTKAEQPRLPGHVAIVTGGSSGIGRAICLALASEGSNVVVVGRSGRRIGEVVEACRSTSPSSPVLIGLSLDVRQEANVEEMAHRTLDRFGRIDCLVTCAGVAKSPGSRRLVPYPLAQMPSEEWDAIVDTNLRGTFLSNRAVLPTMIEQRNGVIMNVSSSPGGYRGQAFASAYCASKFGVVGLSQALAEEVRQFGVKVGVLFPDAIDTPLLKKTTLSRRLGQPLPPERVANLIVYLLASPGDTWLPDSTILPSRLLDNGGGERAARRSPSS